MTQYLHRLSALRQFMRRRHLPGLGVAILGAALLAACGGNATATSIPPTATSVAAPAASVAPATGTSAPARSTATTATTVRKVNANTATEAEIAQALQDAGVPNAARWAKEVAEYRPYPTNDPTFAKLRGELAKYNPGPGIVDQIIAVLSL